MAVADLVRSHYGGTGLTELILHALQDAGVDTDALSVADLAAVDQLHAGFLPATHHFLSQLSLTASSRLLDVGCGIGGPSRVAATAYGCAVVGVDLSPDFVAVARDLTERVGLTALVEHRVSAGDRIDAEDASFDRAMMVHVGMNIEDKAAVFGEVRRVLRTGGIFAVYEQMTTGTAALTYPLPWAEDERSSFLATPDEYDRLLTAAGFTVERMENRVDAPAAAPPRLSPTAVFGPSFLQRLANNIAAARAGTLAPVVMIARAAEH